MKRPPLRGSSVGLALGLLGSAACSDSPVGTTTPPVEIFSWWASPSETAALDAMLEVHERTYPDFEYRNATEGSASNARVRLADRMRKGVPPDTFQANIGMDLFQWVLFSGRGDQESKVAALNDLATANDWFDVFPETVVDALSFEGTMYGVPLNIHRLNTLFFNQRVLAEEDLAPPTTLAELHQRLEELRSRGYDHPLSIGNVNNWTMSLFTMENLFPAIAGPEFYQQYWLGEHEPEHSLMKQTLDELLLLWPYFNEDAMDIDWTEGVELLFHQDQSKQAVFSVMGDWAKGHLSSLDYVPGEDFGTVPFPGSQGTFVFTADCFPLPKGAPHRFEMTELLETFGSKDGQVAFNRLKGSLPARIDIDPEQDLDALGRVTWADFTSDQLVLALSGVIDPDFASALAVAVRDTLLDADPDPVLFALRNNL